LTWGKTDSSIPRPAQFILAQLFDKEDLRGEEGYEVSHLLLNFRRRRRAVEEVRDGRGSRPVEKEN